MPITPESSFISLLSQFPPQPLEATNVLIFFTCVNFTCSRSSRHGIIKYVVLCKDFFPWAQFWDSLMFLCIGSSLCYCWSMFHGWIYHNVFIHFPTEVHWGRSQSGLLDIRLLGAFLYRSLLWNRKFQSTAVQVHLIPKPTCFPLHPVASLQWVWLHYVYAECTSRVFNPKMVHYSVNTNGEIRSLDKNYPDRNSALH